MTENVNLNTSGIFKLNDPGTIKIGKCEHTMFSSGDIFCSLTPEELEAERQAARELMERWEELHLLEQSSKMSLMDFFDRWMKYLNSEDEYIEYKSWRKKYFSRADEDWEDYKYRMDSYDKEKATRSKIEMWRKYHMVADHLWIGALITMAYLAWNDPAWQFWAYVAAILAILNIWMIAFRWRTYFQKDEWEVI